MGIQRPITYVTKEWTVCTRELGPSRSSGSEPYYSSLSSPRVGSLPDTGLFLTLIKKLPQHVLENATVTEILRLLRGVETHPSLE